MSSTEENVLDRPNSNGVGTSPLHAETSSTVEIVGLKSSTGMSGDKVNADKEKELNDADATEEQNVVENHDAKSSPKNTTEKQPESDQKNASSETKPDKTVEEIEDKSGEEKMECVKIKPLTTEEEKSKKEEESAEKGEEKEEEEHEEGKEEEEEEEEEEKQEGKSTSPKKKPRKRAAGSSRKRSPKKKKQATSPSKSKGKKETTEKEEETAVEKETEREKTPLEETTVEKPEVSAETPTKQSPRKKPQKVTAEKEKTPETSPKSSKSEDKTPLLEAPLIVEGKRTRQRVERLDTQMLTPTQKEVNIPQGKGVKLGEIGFIEAMISKTHTNDLKALHKLLFGRPGTPQEIKKNLRGFCGLSFTEDSQEYEKKKKSLDHNCQLKDLKKICEVLGLERGGRKEELVESVMKFLIEPKDQGKKPAQSSANKRKRGSSNGGGSSRKKPASKTKTKAGASGKKDESSAESAGDEDEAEPEEEEHQEEEKVEENDEQEEEEEEPKAKKAKKGKGKAATPKPTAPTPSKRSQAKRAAKKPSFPTDPEIKQTIKELLKGMNLEEVTMKEMTKKVYDKYPNVDITGKKDFIKETVKTLLSSSD